MKVAVEHLFTGTTESLTGTYSSIKTMLGTLMKQYTGVSNEDKYVSAAPSAILNQVEVAGGSYFMPHVVQWSDNIFWVFVASNATAAAIRNLGLYEFDKSTATITWKGFITLTGTTFAGNKTVRGLRGFVYKHTTGIVSTSGLSTTITGSGTGFQSERIAVGARIGFGTTDPTQVTTWYEISAINSDTDLTILGGVDLASSTPYVIEEIRIAVATTNTTILNGGIHLIKGLNYGTFTVGGTSILEASLTTPANTDNIRAIYLLKDPLIKGEASQTCTFTAGTPGTINVNNHGLIVGDLVVFTTTGTLPTGFTPASTIYFVTATNLAANTFTVAATLGGAAITITGAGTGTHTVNTATSYAICGLGSDDFVDNTQHDLYVINLDNISNVRVIEFNLRAALTVTAGFTTSAFDMRTSIQTITGTVPQVNNGRIFSIQHGPHSGVKSLWFVTTTRVYRCAVSGLTSLSNSWISDFMIEVPPGGSTAYTAISTMNQIDYSETIDRLFIPTTSQRIGVYVGEYDTTGLVPFDKLVGANLNRAKFSTTPSGTVDGLFPQATLTIWTSGGYMFAIPSVVTSGLNWLYVFPMGADAKYAPSTNQRIITPKLATPNASKLYRAYVDHAEYMGTYDLGFQPEAYKIYFRTSGIDDNTGSWIEIGANGDLSVYSPGEYIQFMFELDTMGESCIPTRIYSVACVYEDGSQDFHYLPSVAKSSVPSKIFAWQQIVLWNSNIPDLRIKLFDASTNLEIFNDTVNNSSYGTWEYSTNGTTWLAWNNTQDTIGNYIRYTASGFGYSGVTVRAILSQV